VCRQTLRLGAMHGAVAARFRERPDEAALKATLENLMEDKAAACGEVWSAVTAGELPLSQEERLRGGDPPHRRLPVGGDATAAGCRGGCGRTCHALSWRRDGDLSLAV
jgi:hypothetical protein